MIHSNRGLPQHDNVHPSDDGSRTLTHQDAHEHVVYSLSGRNVVILDGLLFSDISVSLL